MHEYINFTCDITCAYLRMITVYVHNIHAYSSYTVSNTFTDIPSPIGLRTVSRICVTYFNISWNASNRITCGDVSYDVSVFQSSIGQRMEQFTRVDDTFYSSITGLNNSDPDVMVTVTASNKAGQGNMSISLQLPKSLGKYYVLCIYCM